MKDERIIELGGGEFIVACAAVATLVVLTASVVRIADALERAHPKPAEVTR